MEKSKKSKPVVLAILDGWGIAQESSGNAIRLAKTPNFNYLTGKYPAFVLQGSGKAVGLPWGEMGNSEVGHMNIGLGKIAYQTLPLISESIWNGKFFENAVLLKAIAHTKKYKSKIHLLGLVSSGGVHSYIDHLYALLDLFKKEKVENFYIHVILDGRDTRYDEGINIIARLQERLEIIGKGKIATLSGRFYAMDRDNHWERTEKAYLAMTQGVCDETCEDPYLAIKKSYQKKIYDEEFVPTVITIDKKPVAKIEDDDAVIFFNFRGDRARQLTESFVLPAFENFNRPRYLQNLFFITFTEYKKGLPVEVAFNFDEPTPPLGKIISDAGLTQYHIAETEKYAHVTYFFNGGQEKPFKGEDRGLIPSPRVSSYDEKPEMGAYEITNNLIEAIKLDKYDFVVVNYANLDMVGHTGNLEATIKAAEVVDECLGNLVKTVLAKDGVILVTADHGNAEELVNLQTGEIDKEHSMNPVPFVLVGKQWEKAKAKEIDLSTLKSSGVLADIAPTILKIMGLEKPKTMTGYSII